MKARRLTFWLAVGGVSILANFGLELVADRFPSASGLGKFVTYTHNGAS